jgi:putative membrane protein
MTMAAEVDSTRARWVIAALSATVMLSVAFVLFVVPARDDHVGPSVLPEVNAALNGTAAVLLTAGWFCVRRRWIRAHRACMTGAFVTSSVFLITYLLHHARVGSVPYTGTGVLRVVYFALLIPHIVLAAAIVPLALFAMYRALVANYRGHKRITRFALPIWLYVSVSGVVIYLMLYGLRF